MVAAPGCPPSVSVWKCWAATAQARSIGWRKLLQRWCCVVSCRWARPLLPMSGYRVTIAMAVIGPEEERARECIRGTGAIQYQYQPVDTGSTARQPEYGGDLGGYPVSVYEDAGACPRGTG